MGGSGGNLPYGGIGGGVIGEGCPRKFEEFLVDVFQTGNIQYAMNLPEGTELNLRFTQDESAISLSHNEKIIGYLPPHRINIIECIKQGWQYSSSIVKISGDEKNPQILVLIIGTL
ncbi:MAG: hypothetical protein ABFD00_06085 [Chloroherpetonaceae bacterium]